MDEKMLKIIIAGFIICVSVIVMHTEISADTKYETPTFAGGCFWCMETPIKKLDGVQEIITGYTGGNKNYTTYDGVSSGTTGHAEVVQLTDNVWGKGRVKKVSDIKDDKYSKPSDEEIREKLSDLQYKVTQKEGTERAFDNAYWDNEKEGIYVDIISGEPLFSSSDKYKSGTGWPSFTKPIDKEFIKEREDRKLFSVRTEIRSKYGDSHLGHVFDDGPGLTGLRYCMNSASLRFIPKEDMGKEGYGDYLKLFEK